MTTLREFMHSNALHSSPEMQHLLLLKAAYSQLEKQIVLGQLAIDDSLKQVKQVLNQAEEKSMHFLHGMSYQLDKAIDELQQTRRTVKLNNHYRCGCGYITDNTSQYKVHQTNQHKRFQLVEGSSHFVSPLGNLYKFELLKLAKKKDSGKPSSSNTHNEQKITSDNLKTTNQRIKSEPKTKFINNKSGNANTAQIVQLKKASEYFCGQCRSTFELFREFCHHIRKHDYIIHPESSHVIVRRKAKNSQAIEVKNSSESKQRYSCPCNAGLNFSKAEFINHIFKWHKGIAPRK